MIWKNVNAVNIPVTFLSLPISLIEMLHIKVLSCLWEDCVDFNGLHVRISVASSKRMLIPQSEIIKLKMEQKEMTEKLNGYLASFFTAEDANNSPELEGREYGRKLQTKRYRSNC